MGKLLKIIVITVVILLVLLSVVSDQHVGIIWQRFEFDLSLYLKIISILSLVIAVFIAKGYKRKIEASQKLQRADDILAEAEATAKRRQASCNRLEEQLKARYIEKKKLLSKELKQVKAEAQLQVRALKEQNVALKENVNKLMKVLKEKE